MNKFKISAVIACYNDQKAIPEMYERLLLIFKKIECEYEIFFVNDGSPDNSSEIIEDICKKDSNVTGIIHSRNFSSQNAFTSGIIGLCIGLIITSIINLFYPSGNLTWNLFAVGTASFFASIGGNISGQQE